MVVVGAGRPGGGRVGGGDGGGKVNRQASVMNDRRTEQVMMMVEKAMEKAGGDKLVSGLPSSPLLATTSFFLPSARRRAVK